MTTTILERSHMSMRWYIVHAYSNFEKKVAESIREQAHQRGLEDKFEEILVPTEQVVEVRRGRKINSERKFFPGYVLVKCDLTDEVYHLIKNTPKVTGFLGADKKPMPIPDHEADRIKGQVADGRRAAEGGDPVRDRRERARGRRAVRLVQRRGRGSRRIAFARQGRGVDLRPRDAGRPRIRPGREGLGVTSPWPAPKRWRWRRTNTPSATYRKPGRVHPMHFLRRKGWEIPTSLTTPEAAFLDRRAFLAGLGAAGAFAAWPGRARADDADPSAALYPAKRNPAYTLDRDVTPEKYNLNYNNFYEFSTSKHVDASALKTRPWTVKIDGLVEKEQTVDIDSLIKAMGLEERLYRHRCVEAWSMAIPWTGFPLKKLVEFARPLSSAKYVRFETFLDKKMAPGQRSFMPWPYVEGLTMAEATNDLAFIATGAYGKPLAKVQGAPIRLATPWKYGFKSVKSIVKVSFVDKRPETFWETLGPDEYGFWANVNPARAASALEPGAAKPSSTTASSARR